MKQSHLAPAFAVLAILGALVGGAAAQNYPVKTIRLIVPYPPGGGNDSLARLFGQKLSAAWGQQIIVDNRPGAGTTIGTALAARAAPDGYTLLLSSIASHGVSPSLYRNPGYEANAWYSMHAPAGTPPAIIRKINGELVKVMALPDVTEKLRQLGSDGVGDTPEHFGAFVRAELEKYSKLIRKAGIKVE